MLRISQRLGLVSLPVVAIACGEILGIEEIEHGVPSDDAATDAGSDASLDAPADAPLPEVIQAPGCVESLTCGTEGSSCCESRLVSGGEYLQGCEFEAGKTPCIDPWGPEHTTRVSSFYLDTFEVTVGRFRQFHEEYNLWRNDGNPKPGDGAHPRIPDSGWRSEWDAELPVDSLNMNFELYCTTLSVNGQFWTWNPYENDGMPLNCVTWPLAFAFCVWNGGRLPTEAEWEYAAVGTDNRNYPWGNDEPTPALANYNHDGPFPELTLTLADVGTHPAGKGPFGHHDLAGSVMEWTLDQYSETFYVAQAQSAAGCDDCANLGTPGDDMVQRGGAWDWGDGELLAASRFDNHGTVTARYSGIRCARDP